MKRVISSDGISYAIDISSRPDGALLEIIHVNRRAAELISRPTLIPLAQAAHDEKDFDSFLLIFQTLKNADIAAMGLQAERQEAA